MVVKAAMRSLRASPFVEMPIALLSVDSVAEMQRPWPLRSGKPDMQMALPSVVTLKVALQAVPPTWPSPSAAAR